MDLVRPFAVKAHHVVAWVLSLKTGSCGAVVIVTLVSATHVVAEVSNAFLGSLSSSSCSSQKAIWDVLALGQVLRDDVLILWNKLLLGLFNVDLQVDALLVLSLLVEAVLPLDGLSSILDAQN
jgi:hypothetical protein